MTRFFVCLFELVADFTTMQQHILQVYVYVAPHDGRTSNQLKVIG